MPYNMNPGPPVVHLTFPDDYTPTERAVGRGRNGCFQPTRASIRDYGPALSSGDPLSLAGTAQLEVRSRRTSDQPPILLRLPKEDMAAIARALLEASVTMAHSAEGK
jgi:hypothetical protein